MDEIAGKAASKSDLLAFVRSTKTGAIGRAREFGFDVTALAIHVLTTTPLERLTQLDHWIEDVEHLRNGMA